MSSNASPTNGDLGYKDGREVEWQLASTDLGAVHRWLTEQGSIDGLVLEPRTTLNIVDTYLDTDDWRIHRAGFALRIRSESGKSEASLKSLHSAGAEAADRRELSETLQSDTSDAVRRSVGPVGTRVQAVSGARALVPLFEVRTSRQRFAVRKEHEARELGEIALDDTVILRPDGEQRTSMQRVEVEALTETHEPLQLLVKSLRSNLALEAASETKYSQGLKSVGLEPGFAPPFTSTAVDGSMTLGEVALANLRRHWSDWNLHEPGARLGDDPEELHDLRVAGRRLDAILRQFRSSLPNALLRIRPTLKKILRALGEVRDLDVALFELESFCRELPTSEREGAVPLKQHLAGERSRARARMIGVLDSIPVQRSLLEWATLLAERSETLLPASSERAVGLAPEMIRRRYRKARKSADLLRPHSPAKAYHEVRGRVKKLRYALESISVVYGKPADDMLRALRRWQDKLGVQQDAAVASRRLRTLAGTRPADIPPETLFLMGRLAEHHASAAVRARKLQSKSYDKVRARYKRLRAKLVQAAAQDPSRPTRPGA